MNLVVRLNSPQYDENVFRKAGIEVVNLFFPDGTSPSKDLYTRFLELVENNHGRVAVHCKAGLGRTGTLLGIYLMKHYRLCANEAIAWLRIVRPGSVIGPQQYFLQSVQDDVFQLTHHSPTWASLSSEYKAFAKHLEDTNERQAVALTKSEMMTTLYGEKEQGEALLMSKLRNESQP